EPYGYVADNPLNRADPSGLKGSPGDQCSMLTGKARIACVANTIKLIHKIKSEPGLCISIGNPNCQPFIQTAGLCLGGGIAGGIGIQGSVCLAEQGLTHWGMTFTGGYSFGLGGGLSFGPEVSNAPCLNSLGGPFANA